MLSQWLGISGTEAKMVLLSGVIVYGTILALTRLAGLRSFSKMSAPDFAMTLAVGSLFASTISSKTPSLGVGLVALGFLFFGQYALALLRKRFTFFSKWIDNQPLLLMRDGKMLPENLVKANVTVEDVLAKLREANVLKYEQVLAVVFETTGDISVLHSDDAEARLDWDILRNVVGVNSQT